MLVVTRKLGQRLSVEPPGSIPPIVLIPVYCTESSTRLIVVTKGWVCRPAIQEWSPAIPGCGSLVLDVAYNRAKFDYPILGMHIEICLNKVISKQRLSIGIDAPREFQVNRFDSF